MIGCHNGSTVLPKERVFLLPLTTLEILQGCAQGRLSEDTPLPTVSPHMRRHTTSMGPKAVHTDEECHFPPKDESTEGHIGIWPGIVSDSKSGGEKLTHLSLETFLIMIKTSKPRLLPREGRHVYFQQIYVLIIISVLQTVQRSKVTPCYSLVFKHQGFSSKQLKVEAQPCPLLPV